MRATRCAIPLALILVAGCVERKLIVTSDPDGALVTLNNQEVGRTPVTRDFTWYGNYDVQARKEGFETRKTDKYVHAPWWQWVPFDLVAEVLPFRFTDTKTMHIRLHPATTESVDPAQIVARATDYRRQLEGSENTRAPTSAPSKVRSATMRSATTVP